MSKKSRLLRDQGLLDVVITTGENCPIKVYKNGVIVVNKKRQ